MKRRGGKNGVEATPQALANAINRSTTRAARDGCFAAVVRRSFTDLRISSMEAVITRDRRLGAIGD